MDVIGTIGMEWTLLAIGDWRLDIIGEIDKNDKEGTLWYDLQGVEVIGKTGNLKEGRTFLAKWGTRRVSLMSGT